MVNLDKCIRSCNTLHDLSTKLSVPNKAEDLNLSVLSSLQEEMLKNVKKGYIMWMYL